MHDIQKNKVEEIFFTIILLQVEFMMYDLIYEKILTRVSCGGGHRSWDCMVWNGTARLAYIRNKQIYVAHYPLKSLQLPILQVRDTNLFRKFYKVF